eukprot:m.57921 g.57921  ORF g.57921 m.57921 type:complete len:202 (-) comp6860_c0_seq3:191-796(-)
MIFLRFACFKMATAYGHISRPPVVLDCLPMRVTLRDGSAAVIDRVQEADIEQARTMLNTVIEEGQTYPQLDVLDPQGFRNYFLSHDAFALKKEGDATGLLVGIFYIKPNFPGRCSHICNGGFIVHPSSRNQGVGQVLGTAFLQLAKLLGYEAAMFNLVFVSNIASVRLWKTLGFTELARLPRAGNLKGLGFTDAVMMHKVL